VRQFWAKECLAAPEATLDAVVSQLQQAGVRSVYISNDVDGTDARWIDATGTPEPGGLEPPFVHALLKRLGQEFHLLGADVMELAPNLRPKPDSAERSIGIAVDYLQTSLEALLHCRPDSTTTSSSTP
jgi:agmatinase